MKRSAQDLTAMAAAIGSHEATARQWLDEGSTLQLTNPCHYHALPL